jgi:hypothetical protein
MSSRIQTSETVNVSISQRSNHEGEHSHPDSSIASRNSHNSSYFALSGSSSTEGAATVLPVVTNDHGSHHDESNEIDNSTFIDNDSCQSSVLSVSIASSSTPESSSSLSHDGDELSSLSEDGVSGSFLLSDDDV